MARTVKGATTKQRQRATAKSRGQQYKQQDKDRYKQQLDKLSPKQRKAGLKTS